MNSPGTESPGFRATNSSDAALPCRSPAVSRTPVCRLPGPSRPTIFGGYSVGLRRPLPQPPRPGPSNAAYVVLPAGDRSSAHSRRGDPQPSWVGPAAAWGPVRDPRQGEDTPKDVVDYTGTAAPQSNQAGACSPTPRCGPDKE